MFIFLREQHLCEKVLYKRKNASYVFDYMLHFQNTVEVTTFPLEVCCMSPLFVLVW